MLEDGFFDKAKPVHIRGGDLPHWRQDGGLYFVTFRLSDSLPQTLLKQWEGEREGRVVDHQSLWKRSVEHRRRTERWLDKGYGSCILRNAMSKRIVSHAIRYFDGEQYELGDFAVAANHVHALVRTALDVDLSQVLYSWKRYSSTELLKMPEVRKAFDGKRHLWQTESFDHIVRNSRSLERISEYIRGHDQLGQAE